MSTVAARRGRFLLIAAAAALLIAGCRSTSPATAPAATSADTWAVVNGKEITRNDVDRAFRQSGDTTQPLSEEETLTAKLSILDDLILEEILVARARQQNIQVPDAEVDTAFANAKKNASDADFQRQLADRKLTVAEVREGLRRQLLAQKLIDRDVTAKVTVTDQQITDFFNANRAKFSVPEDAFHLAQIIVTPGPDQQIANRTGDDATTPAAANAKVAMLMQRLQQGTAFADLARDYSEDPESAPRGGDLGLVPMSAVKQAPPPLRDAVLQLTPGRAKVVNQGGGITIVYVVAREQAGQRDLATPGVRDQITQALRGGREQLLRTAYLTAARNDATVVNYLARRLVESQGRSAEPQPPATK